MEWLVVLIPLVLLIGTLGFVWYRLNVVLPRKIQDERAKHQEEGREGK